MQPSERHLCYLMPAGHVWERYCKCVNVHGPPFFVYVIYFIPCLQLTFQSGFYVMSLLSGGEHKASATWLCWKTDSVIVLPSISVRHEVAFKWGESKCDTDFCCCFKVSFALQLCSKVHDVSNPAVSPTLNMSTGQILVLNIRVNTLLTDWGAWGMQHFETGVFQGKMGTGEDSRVGGCGTSKPQLHQNHGSTLCLPTWHRAAFLCAV